MPAPRARRPAPADPSDPAARAGRGEPAAACRSAAKNVAFVQSSLDGPADKPFTLTFDNQDKGTPHNVDHE